ncbi:DUF4012 domain-containing protein [Gordonia sp. UBA7860]|uniref:DUF4012 domain-containing protein n=1 Tax=Gordonia sp. UBA7860 TaxID=1946579 RepID=UPI00257FC144|nr:DUF4012 domain-containing protein [Gordonia sp. UBA7860]
MGLFPRRANHDDSTDDSDSTTNKPGSGRTAFRRRNLVLAGVAVIVIIAAYCVWLVVQAQSAKSSLEQARTLSQQSKDALLHEDMSSASRLAGEAQQHAQDASDTTHSVSWNVAAAVPWLGSPLRTAQQISDVALGLTSEVLKPTADLGGSVAPDSLLAGGRVDVAALRSEAPALTKISAAATRLDKDAQAIQDPHFVSSLGDARSQVQTQTTDVAHLVNYTSIAANIAPAMLGADGPRTYFMAFQTNAEARGTGGLLGGFGILRFDDGKPTVDDLGANSELNKAFTPISLGPEYEEQYGYTRPTTDFRNSNQSAHFPYAAQIWKSMWKQQSGMDVDGVVALDPIALSYILGATGPVTMPDAEVITKDNVVELTESTAYIRYPDDQAARKAYLQGIAIEVVKKLTGPLKSPQEVLRALGHGVSEHRISVWSATPDIQKQLETTPLANVIPNDRAPYAQFVVNNLGGNKMDYYLKRQIEYTAAACTPGTRKSTATIKLTNTLKDASGLPDYVAGKMGFFPGLATDVPQGSMISSVRLLTTTGAQVASVKVDGQPVQVIGSTERGHPAFEATVAVPPGETATLTFELTEPSEPGAARVPVQPLIDNATPRMSVPACSE